MSLVVTAVAGGITVGMMVQGTLRAVNTFHSVEERVEGVHVM